jgi:antitoxin component of MazEF toxin-antitoxin module
MSTPKKIHSSIEKWGNIHAIPIATNIATTFVKAGNRRVLCTINGQHCLHAALMTRKEQGDYYIYASKALLKKLQLKAGNPLQVQLEPDNSAYQFDMPEELAEVLATDPDAHAIFHALTPGRQRGLIHLVALVKTVDKKIERALKIADKIKAGITSPTAILK